MHQHNQPNMPNKKKLIEKNQINIIVKMTLSKKLLLHLH